MIGNIAQKESFLKGSFLMPSAFRARIFAFRAVLRFVTQNVLKLSMYQCSDDGAQIKRIEIKNQDGIFHKFSCLMM